MASALPSFVLKSEDDADTYSAPLARLDAILRLEAARAEMGYDIVGVTDDAPDEI